MFVSNHMVQRPPTLVEGLILYGFGFVFFQLIFHFCHRWLRNSSFLEALQKLLLSSDDVIKLKPHARDVINTKQHASDVTKSKTHFDEALIFELSNWLVSTVQVCLLIVKIFGSNLLSKM